ncbi:37783_t:CDS:2 [Gigaspora margarita]|uniref:37783_t:CDS:1 n=1 Tax=Gigaspora margarita TaxID=4874 RepID=A0ABN7V165_GIGMA|nr:37783_t:CDS:2 [Gigaspora margarita]
MLKQYLELKQKSPAEVLSNPRVTLEKKERRMLRDIVADSEKKEWVAAFG